MQRKRVFSLLLALVLVCGLLPTASADDMTELTLPNGDFETGDTTNWTVTGLPDNPVRSNEWNEPNTSYTLNLWAHDTEAVEIHAAYTVKLTAGSYRFRFRISGEGVDSGLRWTIRTGDTLLAAQDGTVTTVDWNVWNTVETDVFTLAEPAEVTFDFGGTGPVKYWGDLDDLQLFGTGALWEETPEDPQDPDAGIYVPKIAEAGRDGFIRGTDVSSWLSLYRSGATFYDFDGNALTPQGFFDLLAASGFNWVRLRVWNDPYDENGNGYGGGNNDLEAAVTMGKWATNAGLRVLIDFHYSDFWADPGKQKAPKAWADYTIAQKEAAVYDFTKASLQALSAAGVDVGMVQVGNETNGKVCGESGWDNMARIFNAGSRAVREVFSEAKVAVHFTNPEKTGLQAGYAAQLDSNGVDYDVFATSWYPYWHGSLTNLTSVLKNIADTYGKQVMVAETSWAWTLEDGDGWDNTVSALGNNENNAWPFTPQGQAAELCDVTRAVLNTGDNGLGLFYWENAWIPVQYAYDENGERDPDILASNQEKWETFGSGWAASYGGGYDADAGQWYGGSAVDNQAMFDFTGHPLASLRTFRYMLNGAAQTVIETVESIEAPAITIEQGETLTLPETVKVQYGTAGSVPEAVTWDADELAAVDVNTPGVYTVRGVVNVTKVAGDFTTTATVTVLRPNLLSNPGFEQADLSMYTGTSTGDRSKDTPHSGTWCYHFYNANGGTFALSQSVTLEPGVYEFALYAQGDVIGASGQQIYVRLGEDTLTADFTLSGWKNWANPVVRFTVSERQNVTVGVNIPYGNGGWGTVDDWSLRRQPGFVGHSLTLNDDIGLNFLVDLCGADPASAVVDFRWTVALANGETVEKTAQVRLSDAETVSGGAFAGCYQAPVQVSAKEMTTPVTATLRLGGTEAATDLFSAAAYAQSILADSAHAQYSEALWNLVRAMLIYGGQSQRMFGYESDNLADASLAPYTLSAPSGLQPNAVPANLADFGLALKATSVLLESRTVYRLYFRVTDAEKFAAATVRLNGAALQWAQRADSALIYCEITGIAAKELLDVFTLTFESGTGSAAASVSIQDYILHALGGDDEQLRNTVIALYEYCKAAEAYFQSVQP